MKNIGPLGATMSTTPPEQPSHRHVLPPLVIGIRSFVIGGGIFFYSALDYLRYVPPFAQGIQGVVLFLLTLWTASKFIRRERLPWTPLTIPLVAFLGATTLSTFFSIDMRRSVDGLLLTLTLVLGFFLLCDRLLGNWSPQAFVQIILSTATIALAVGLWKMVGHFWRIWQGRVEGYPLTLITYRLFGVTDHPNFLAAMLNLAFPFAAMQLASARGWGGRVGWVLWLLTYEVVLFFTRSRGGTMAALGATTVLVTALLLMQGLPHRVGMRIWFSRVWPILLTTAGGIGVFLLLSYGSELLALLDRNVFSPVRSAYTTNAAPTIAGALQNHRMVLWGIAWKQFLAHPLTGSGPLTFAHAYVATMWSVRFWVPSYAHNLFFELLGSQGILGILPFGWMVLTGGWVFGRALWRAIIGAPCPPSPPTDPRGSPVLRSTSPTLLPAICAGLSGYLIHSLVDVIGKMPANDLLVLMLVAMGLHSSGMLRRDPRPMSRTMIGATWGFVVPCLSFVLMRYGAGQEALLEGVRQALDGKWTAAAQQVDRAVAEDPMFAFYTGQRGYAYSILAAPIGGADDPVARREALASYALALQREPPYLPHLLNMAALLEYEGESASAISLLERAVELPQITYWALPSLLLGDAYTKMGRADEAEALFLKAFASEAHAPEMAACQRNALCRTLAARAAEQATLEWRIHRQVRDLLKQHAPQPALDLLDTIPLSSADPMPWIDRADVHLALGQIDQARYALNIAETLRHANPYDPPTRIPMALSWARLLSHEGEQQQALEVLSRAAQPRLTRDGYGYGTFRRIGLPGNLQPRLDLLQRTADDLTLYRMLEQHYTAAGMAHDAAWARQRADMLMQLLMPQEVGGGKVQDDGRQDTSWCGSNGQCARTQHQFLAFSPR